MALQKPTPEIVQKYNDRFSNDARYQVADNSLEKLFAVFPHNTTLDEILLKVTTLNALYSTNIYNVFEVAKHILALKIDASLKENSADIVGKIATISIKGNQWRFYSFATKYCSWHKPAEYPIYDRFVDHLLWTYQKQYRFANFHRYELQQYEKFRDIVSQFQARYELHQFSFKQLDKFLWYYGKEI